MLDYTEIDWNLLWQKARQKKKSGKTSQASHWDKRADSFRKRTRHSVYSDKFIQLLRPKKDWTVLDIGCGPGTLALPLAGLVSHVTAVDFSPRMLSLLDAEATRNGNSNITTVKASWDDDWHSRSIPLHDIVIASRSLAVNDLKSALEKLTSFARKAVCITDRVDHGPLDPDAYAAVGRPVHSGPDYIYTLNLLYQMGIRATVDFIKLDETHSYATFEETVSSFLWMFREELNKREKDLLYQYVESIASQRKNGDWKVKRKRVPSWAFISWAISD